MNADRSVTWRPPLPPSLPPSPPPLPRVFSMGSLRPQVAACFNKILADPSCSAAKSRIQSMQTNLTDRYYQYCGQYCVSVVSVLCQGCVSIVSVLRSKLCHCCFSIVSVLGHDSVNIMSVLCQYCFTTAVSIVFSIVSVLRTVLC